MDGSIPGVLPTANITYNYLEYLMLMCCKFPERVKRKPKVPDTLWFSSCKREAWWSEKWKALTYRTITSVQLFRVGRYLLFCSHYSDRFLVNTVASFCHKILPKTCIYKGRWWDSLGNRGRAEEEGREVIKIYGPGMFTLSLPFTPEAGRGWLCWALHDWK